MTIAKRGQDSALKCLYLVVESPVANDVKKRVLEREKELVDMLTKTSSFIKELADANMFNSSQIENLLNEINDIV